MATVSEEGKSLLVEAERRSNMLRTMKADFEERMQIAFSRESEQRREDLAQTVAALLDAKVGKTRIAAACGYKNYYVSLKDIDARAQKYRWINATEQGRPLPVPNDGEAPSVQWEILEASEWTEPNQWGEREISLQMLFGDVRATVWVTEAENKRDITYVDLPENPSVTIADVKALKNEITGALDG